MVRGGNYVGGQGLVRIAFDCAAPAGHAPDDHQASEDHGENAKGSFALLSQALRNAGDEKGGDQDAGRDVPEGHPVRMGTFTKDCKA